MFENRRNLITTVLSHIEVECGRGRPGAAERKILSGADPGPGEPVKKKRRAIHRLNDVTGGRAGRLCPTCTSRCGGNGGGGFKRRVRGGRGSHRRSVAILRREREKTAGKAKVSSKKRLTSPKGKKRVPSDMWDRKEMTASEWLNRRKKREDLGSMVGA